MSHTILGTPLPAIEIAGEGWVSWQPRLYFQRIDDYYGDKEDVWKRMTLAHLVAVLAALTPEQFAATISSLSDDRKQSAAAAIDWPDEREVYERNGQDLYEQACRFERERDLEKERANREERRAQGAVEFLRNHGDYLLRRPISNPAALALIALKKELGIDV